MGVRLGRVVVVSVVGLLVYGCGEGAGPGVGDAASSGSATTTSSVESSAGSSPPVADGESGRVSVENRRFLFAAQEQLVAACMADQGFVYRPAQLPVDDLTGGLGLATDVDRARVEGYGFDRLTSEEASGGSSGGDDPGSGVDPNAGYLASLSEGEVQSWVEALQGSGSTTVEEPGEGDETVLVPTDGCARQVEAAVYGDLGEWRSAVAVFDSIEVEVYDRTEGDSRLATARSLWVDCMASKGFAYSDPEEPQTEAFLGYLQGGDRAAARTREIAIATADAECVAESQLAEIYVTLRAAHRAEAEQRREGQLAEVLRLEEAAVRRAKGLLDGS